MMSIYQVDEYLILRIVVFFSEELVASNGFIRLGWERETLVLKFRASGES